MCFHSVLLWQATYFHGSFTNVFSWAFPHCLKEYTGHCQGRTHLAKREQWSNRVNAFILSEFPLKHNNRKILSKWTGEVDLWPSYSYSSNWKRQNWTTSHHLSYCFRLEYNIIQWIWLWKLNDVIILLISTLLVLFFINLKLSNTY